MPVTAKRYHDFCAGHRVHGHESKCAHLHGHNYRVHFTIEGETDTFYDVDLGEIESYKRSGGTDAIGRVMDFSVIKSKLCEWLEENWDHKFLVWEKDPICSYLTDIDPEGTVWVPFNPTAENMAEYLVMEVGPNQLRDTGCKLISCEIEETRKCSASFSL